MLLAQPNFMIIRCTQNSIYTRQLMIIEFQSCDRRLTNIAARKSNCIFKFYLYFSLNVNWLLHVNKSTLNLKLHLACISQCYIYAVVCMLYTV